MLSARVPGAWLEGGVQGSLLARAPGWMVEYRVNCLLGLLGVQAQQFLALGGSSRHHQLSEYSVTQSYERLGRVRGGNSTSEISLANT